MARRRGFHTQAPRRGTFIVAAILWLIGLAGIVGILRAGQLGLYALLIAGFILLLGSITDLL